MKSLLSSVARALGRLNRPLSVFARNLAAGGFRGRLFVVGMAHEGLEAAESVAALPVAPDGVGVSETASALLFSQHGVASGAAIMLLYRLWLLVLSLGALILGLVQSGSAYFMLFYPLIKNLHEPLTLPLLAQAALSVPLFVPQVIVGLGLAVGGLIGLIRTLQAMQEL